MPMHGHNFGIDAITLNVPWAAIAGWRPAVAPNPADPVFAGRYFFPGHVWVNGEGTAVKRDQHGNPGPNPNLAYIFPLQGPGDQAQSLKMQGRQANGNVEKKDIVQGWGAADAKTTCTRVLQVVKSAELKFPTFCESVIIYLDVEPGMNLSPYYWYGWASKVYWFCNGIHRPFYPGIYCPTMHDPEQAGDHWHHRIPELNIVTGPGDMRSPPWVTNNMAVTFDQAGVIQAHASSLRATAANATCMQSVTLPSAKRYQSAWLKRLNGAGAVQMTMDDGGTWTAVPVPADNQWHRRSIPPQVIENPRVGFRLVANGDRIAVDFGTDVHLGLTERPNNLASLCYGIFAASPEDDNSGFSPPGPRGADARFQRNFLPDWRSAAGVDRFDEWKQTVKVIFGHIPWSSGIPVRLWQYASQPLNPANQTQVNFNNTLHADLNETSPDGSAIKWMLSLP